MRVLYRQTDTWKQAWLECGNRKSDEIRKLFICCVVNPLVVYISWVILGAGRVVHLISAFVMFQFLTDWPCAPAVVGSMAQLRDEPCIWVSMIDTKRQQAWEYHGPNICRWFYAGMPHTVEFCCSFNTERRILQITATLNCFQFIWTIWTMYENCRDYKPDVLHEKVES